jgi:2'-5' RNA ligase
MRVYVALPLPGTFKAELRRRLLPFRKENPSYRWVDDAEDLHITINFPGEMEVYGTQFVLDAVRQSAAGFGPIRTSAAAFFLCAYHCTAIKFRDGVEEMTALADSIDAALTRIGNKTGYMFREKIERPFTPYIVVVRRGRPRNTIVLHRKGKDLKETLNPPLECVLDKVAVYMSDKISSGNVRTVQKVFRL